jgi:hypothetical protein
MQRGVERKLVDVLVAEEAHSTGGFCGAFDPTLLCD